MIGVVGAARGRDAPGGPEGGLVQGAAPEDGVHFQSAGDGDAPRSLVLGPWSLVLKKQREQGEEHRRSLARGKRGVYEFVALADRFGAEVVDSEACLCNTMCVFRIEIAPPADGHLAELRAHERAAVAEAILRDLAHEPTTPTRRRKLLEGARPPFAAVPPVRQLRVGEIRVFYDADEDTKTVTVRAIRRKPPHKTTEEIL